MAKVISDTEALTVILDVAEVSVPLTDKEYSDTSKAMIETMGRKSDCRATSCA